MSIHIPFDHMTDDERRGAQAMMAHIRAIGTKMAGNTRGMSPLQARRLRLSAAAIRTAADIARHDMLPDLPVHLWKD